MKKVRILICQYKIRHLDIESNLEKFERIIKKNQYLKPDLVIFPEYALTGLLYGHSNLALKQNDPVFMRLSFLAKKYRIYLVPGSFVRIIGKKRYNSTCLTSPQGKILDYANKQCLWSSEKLFLKKGRSPKIIKTKIGRVALQVCADIFSSKISSSYRKTKPDIIINASLWSQQDKNNCRKNVPETLEFTQTEVLARSRALENQAYFIFCNYADKQIVKAKSGKRFEFKSIGHSMVVDPYGHIVAKASSGREQIIFADLDLSKCQWAKYCYV